ncbi:MAG: efflux RND transporter periplasmic adaptor subunit [Thermoanaerobaculia bacterium]|nr:efflux RND transporter periplasmic adaptor subunit [Thermoanaerobaculia bacterium]
MRTAITILISCLLPWLAGCAGDADAGNVSTSDVVREGRFTDRILLTGEVDAAVAESVTVPRLPSWQTSIKWLAEEGARVEKGEKVVELDTASFASDLDSRIEAEAEAREKLRQHLEETRADLAEKEFSFLSKQTDYQTAKMNAEVPPEILSKKEYEERQLALERAKTELEKAWTLLDSTRSSRAAERENLEIDLEEKRRQIAIAERALETMTLYAPVAGVFVLNEHPWFGRKLEVGDNAWVGFQLARIPDLSTLQVRAELFDVDDGRVEPGMPAKVVIDAFPGRTYQGRISRVSSVAEEEGGRSLRRSFEVLVELDDIDAELRPGLSARVEVETLRLEDATVVRRRAIDFTGETPSMTLEDGSNVPIELIACNPLECAVETLDPESTDRMASR